METSQPAIKIGREQLKTIQSFTLAFAPTIKGETMTYLEAQQTLTLRGLLEFLHLYEIPAPFEIDEELLR